jgi:tetratricopeptide (TPR) repeat protein
MLILQASETLRYPNQQMKISKLLRTTTFLAGLVCLTACGQSETAGLPTDKPVVAAQTNWQELTNTADAAAKKGDKAAAERYYKEAMQAALQLGADNPSQAESMANLANFYYVQGDGAQANDLYKQALAIHEKAKGLEHVDLIKDLVGLARVCQSEKKDDEAKAYYERAMVIAEKAKQPLPADVAADMAKLKTQTK